MAGDLRNMMAVYMENEDLINIGAYQRGTNPEIDRAIDLKSKIDNFLKQGIYEQVGFQDTLNKLRAIFR
jgi:flagellum-specific ATP synthase